MLVTLSRIILLVFNTLLGVIGIGSVILGVIVYYGKIQYSAGIPRTADIIFIALGCRHLGVCMDRLCWCKASKEMVAICLRRLYPYLVCRYTLVSI